jgi:hypothetical protein
LRAPSLICCFFHSLTVDSSLLLNSVFLHRCAQAGIDHRATCSSRLDSNDFPGFPTSATTTEPNY